MTIASASLNPLINFQFHHSRLLDGELCCLFYKVRQCKRTEWQDVEWRLIHAVDMNHSCCLEWKNGAVVICVAPKRFLFGRGGYEGFSFILLTTRRGNYREKQLEIGSFTVFHCVLNQRYFLCALNILLSDTFITVVLNRRTRRTFICLSVCFTTLRSGSLYVQLRLVPCWQKCYSVWPTIWLLRKSDSDTRPTCKIMQQRVCLKVFCDNITKKKDLHWLHYM